MFNLGRGFNGIANLTEEMEAEDAADWVQGMAERVENLPPDSTVRAALYALLNETGIAYNTQATGPAPAGIPVLVVRDPDSANVYTSDQPIDVVNIDISGREVEDMGESAYQQWADGLWGRWPISTPTIRSVSHSSALSTNYANHNRGHSNNRGLRQLAVDLPLRRIEKRQRRRRRAERGLEPHPV